MKYTQVNALFLMLVFCTSCGGQNKPDLPKENIKPETKDIVTSTGSNETYHTNIHLTLPNNAIGICNSIELLYFGRIKSKVTAKRTDAIQMPVLRRAQNVSCKH